MKQNQQDKNLQSLRVEINQIDNQIISLLQQRIEVVARVGDLKRNNGEKFFIKSAREADMIKSLINGAGSDIPKAMIASIWRKIITSANMYEQPINVVVYNPKGLSDYKYLVREYYSEVVPVIDCKSAGRVISELEKNNEQIAAFPIPDKAAAEEEYWWINLSNNTIGLKIFAKAPLVRFESKDGEVELFLSAVKVPEKSGSDSSLFVVEFDEKLSEGDLLEVLKSHGFQARILKSAKLKQIAEVTFNLVEIEGFYLEGDAALDLLQSDKTRPFVKVIGHFAHQIEG